MLHKRACKSLSGGVIIALSGPYLQWLRVGLFMVLFYGTFGQHRLTPWRLCFIIAMTVIVAL